MLWLWWLIREFILSICLTKHQVQESWWSTTPWTASRTWRRRPGRLLTLRCITSQEIFFKEDVVVCCGWHETCLFLQHIWPHKVHVSWWETALWKARTTRRRRPGRSLIFVCITSNIHQLKFSSTRMWYAVVMEVDMKLVYSFNMSDHI